MGFWAGKSKKGELSIFVKSIELLSYCLHMLPKTYAKGGKDHAEKSLEKKLSEVAIDSVRYLHLAQSSASKHMRSSINLDLPSTAIYVNHSNQYLYSSSSNFENLFFRRITKWPSSGILVPPGTWIVMY